MHVPSLIDVICTIHSTNIVENSIIYQGNHLFFKKNLIKVRNSTIDSYHHEKQITISLYQTICFK